MLPPPQSCKRSCSLIQHFTLAAMSSSSSPSGFQTLTAELKALAIGHWQLFRQEMSGKVTHTRQQTLWMAAGALTALTAILLLLSGITLLLSQLLVSSAGWPSA